MDYRPTSFWSHVKNSITTVGAYYNTIIVGLHTCMQIYQWDYKRTPPTAKLH